MTDLSDAFKDEMTRGAIVNLTDDDFATINAPSKAGPWMRHSVAFYGGSGKKAKIIQTAVYAVFWLGLMIADLALAEIGEIDRFVALIALAAGIIGSFWHMRLAKITCLRAAGYSYDWQTHTARKLGSPGKSA